MALWICVNRSNSPVYFPGASFSRLRTMEKTLTETEVQAARTKVIPKGLDACSASSISAMISSALWLALSSSLKLW